MTGDVRQSGHESGLPIGLKQCRVESAFRIKLASTCMIGAVRVKNKSSYGKRIDNQGFELPLLKVGISRSAGFIELFLTQGDETLTLSLLENGRY
ncbi:MAG: hypothetical protein ACPF9K_03040 [Neptuniibacter sp.]